MDEKQVTFQDQLQKFRGMQEEIIKASQELENKKARYKMEMKQAFGITDGEPANILDLIEAVRKVQGMA